MIIPDANLLIYAYDSKSDQQPRAAAWLEEILSGDESVGMTWISIGAFLRISTNMQLGRSRLPVQTAIEIVDAWLAQRIVQLIVPGDRHWPLLKQAMVAGRVQGTNVTDAQLAALTMEYGGVLYSTDRDFARLPGLRWTNPLQS